MNLWLFGIALCLLGAVITVLYCVAEFVAKYSPKLWIIQFAVVCWMAGISLALGSLFWEALA